MIVNKTNALPTGLHVPEAETVWRVFVTFSSLKKSCKKQRQIRDMSSHFHPSRCPTMQRLKFKKPKKQRKIAASN